MSETADNPKPAPPSPTGDNGRRPNGTFAPGTGLAKGNPLAKKAQQFRMAVARAVTVADLRAIAKKLVELAKGGDVAAAKMLFDRTIGPPVEPDIAERLDRLEAVALEKEES